MNSRTNGLKLEKPFKLWMYVWFFILKKMLTNYIGVKWSPIQKISYKIDVLYHWMVVYNLMAVKANGRLVDKMLFRTSCLLCTIWSKECYKPTTREIYATGFLWQFVTESAIGFESDREEKEEKGRVKEKEKESI